MAIEKYSRFRQFMSFVYKTETEKKQATSERKRKRERKIEPINY